MIYFKQLNILVENDFLFRDISESTEGHAGEYLFATPSLRGSDNLANSWSSPCW